MSSSATPPRPASKAELLARIEQARAALKRAIARASAAELVMPGPGGWSIKDHLAHLTTWERTLLPALAGRPRDSLFELEDGALAKVNLAGANFDELNAMIYERNRDRLLVQVLTDFREVHQQVLAALTAAPESVLFGLYEGRPMLDLILGNTEEHDQEHQQTIEHMLSAVSHA